MQARLDRVIPHMCGVTAATAVLGQIASAVEARDVPSPDVAWWAAWVGGVLVGHLIVPRLVRRLDSRLDSRRIALLDEAATVVGAMLLLLAQVVATVAVGAAFMLGAVLLGVGVARASLWAVGAGVGVAIVAIGPLYDAVSHRGLGQLVPLAVLLLHIGAVGAMRRYRRPELGARGGAATGTWRQRMTVVNGAVACMLCGLLPTAPAAALMADGWPARGERRRGRRWVSPVPTAAVAPHTRSRAGGA